MIAVKRIGAAMLAASMAAGMLQTAGLAVETDATSDAIQTITGFTEAGQRIGTVPFTEGQEESALTAQMPQTLTATLADNTVEEIPVTWVSLSDYETSDDFYYEFVPQWDEDTYVLADGLDSVTDVPYVVAEREETTEVSGEVEITAQSALSANAYTIFDFLVAEMGYSNAAACGVLANIKAESNFNPNSYGDSGTSYGICQWHNSRFTALKNWCSANGYDWKTLDGQLHYLQKEMSANNNAYLYNGATINQQMKSYGNSASDAYNAGYYWCYYYEVPANRGSVAVARATQAKNTYWPEFGEYTHNTSSSGNGVFIDVNLDAWYKDAVEYVYNNKLMVGTSDTEFSPGLSMSRAMVAQILYNIAGKPAVTGEAPFSDVPSDKWYYNAVLWAYQNNIIAGTEEQIFEPNSDITREQFATILYRYEQSPAVSGTLGFQDADTVSEWAANAMLWVTQNNIISGTQTDSGIYLDPKGTATRAQSAMILMRYLER
ncbi:MAG: phage tail tip lysozyme [Eubacteriales bacterium]|nr:phage tail tip lysozyme [Eubacteriales bacterium]